MYQFWEPVYYKLDDSNFPSDSTEKLGHFVGIAEHVGHAMTFKVLTADTHKIIFRSRIRSALKNGESNLLAGEDAKAVTSKIIKFFHIDGAINPADILSKHWGYPQVWPMLQALLFWQGDTRELLDDWIGYYLLHICYDGLDVGYGAELRPHVSHINIKWEDQVMNFQRHEGLD